MKDYRTGIKSLVDLGFSKLYVSAGMHRSGSTLLYNAIRLCLLSRYSKLSCGFVSDLGTIDKSPVYLIKTHNIYNVLRYRSNMIFYSYRDVRDAMVSMSRKFGKPPTLEMCDAFIEEFIRAKRCSHFIYRYEDFSLDYVALVENVSRDLGILVDLDQIVSGLPRASVGSEETAGPDLQTQMHGGHASGTKACEWRDVWPKALQLEVNNKYKWWFEENCYPLS